MQDERDVLVKRVFPELRRRFAGRGPSLTEIDLRWGVTRTEVDEGRLLPICFAEIDRCRPYFLAVLGERYGWVPSEISAELRQQHPWLDQHADASVTELEIRHAVLGHPSATTSRFYFRDPSMLEALAPHLADSDYRAENAHAAARLGALKQAIRDAGCVVHVYTSLREFEQLLLEDLADILNEIAPPVTVSHPLERERRAHRRFAEQAAAAYVPVATAVTRLSHHISGAGPPLVVSGDPGAGKSALLAYWWLAYESGAIRTSEIGQTLWQRLKSWRTEVVQDTARAPCVAHFVGASGASTDWGSLVYRVLHEIKSLCGLRVDIPTDPSALRAVFFRTMAEVGARHRLVLVLDGIDHLEDPPEGGRPFGWLPETLPTGIRLIVSVAPGPCLDGLRSRGWPTYEVPPLDFEARRALVRTYLERFSKRLDGQVVDDLIRAPAATNPLWLHTSIEELRIFGRYEELPNVARNQARLANVTALYASVFDRCERDFEADRPRLVADAMSLLAVARSGLAESELLALLGTPPEPLACALWSPLSLALSAVLVTRSGLLTFAHAPARSAATERYLATAEVRRERERYLADWLRHSATLERQIEELPWQLIALGDWVGLRECLARPAFVDRAMALYPLQFVRWWRTLEMRLGTQAPEAFREVLAAPDAYRDCAGAVAILLSELGHTESALRLGDWLINRYRSAGTVDEFLMWVERQATALRRAGLYDKALELLEQQQHTAEGAGRDGVVRRSLGNQAVVLRDLGRWSDAITRHEQEAELSQAAGDEIEFAYSLQNRASLYRELGRSSEALPVLQQAEAIFRTRGEWYAVQACLGARADVERERGDRRSARRASDEQERLCRQLGDPEALQRCLTTRANVLQEDEDYDGASAALAEQQRLCRELGNDAGLARGLAIEATLKANLRWNEDAHRLAHEAMRKADAIGDRDLMRELRRQLRHLLAPNAE